MSHSDMLLNLGLVYLAFLGFLISLYGWGRGILAICGEQEHRLPFYAVAIGLASWAFLGGILNLVGVAYPLVLLGIALIGLGLFAIPFKAQIQIFKNTLHFQTLLAYAGLFLFTLLLIAAVYPYYFSFNLIDDLTQYLPRIARALALGSSGGDEFSGEGLDSLGVQTFLQSFIALTGTYQYVVLFDFAFCFFVALGLIIDVHVLLKIKNYWPALLIFILINPQLVNISPVYSSALFGIAVAISLIKLTPRLTEAQLPGLCELLPLALLSAAMLGLKLTLIPFIVGFVALYFVWMSIKDKRRNALAYVKLVILTGACILPWILVYYDKYGYALFAEKFNSPVAAQGHFTLEYFTDALKRIAQLFDARHELFYGGGVPLSYTLCLLILVMLTLFLLTKCRNAYYAPVIFSGVATYALLYLLFPVVFYDFNQTFRYLTPMLLIIFPLVLGIFNQEMRSSAKHGLFGKIFTVSLAFILLLPLADFSETFLKRARNVFHFNSYLSFPDAMSPSIQKEVLRLFTETENIMTAQTLIPQGEKILTWLAVPFHLDYTRNVIHQLNPVGYLTPWINIPFDRNSNVLKTYLQEKNITYVMWGYQGNTIYSENVLQRKAAVPDYPIRRAAFYELYLRDKLTDVKTQSHVLYDDGTLVLFQLSD